MRRPGWSGSDIPPPGCPLGDALASTVTGFIVQATGSFVPALLVSTSIGLVSALMCLLVIRGEPITTAELDAIAGIGTTQLS